MTKPFKFPSLHILLLSSALLLLIPGLIFGQVSTFNSNTATPVPGVGHDYIKMVNETVNPADGSISLRISIPVPPGRGLTIPFSFAYDSNGVHYPTGGSPGQIVWASNTGFISNGGWSYAVPLASQTLNSVTYSGPPTYTCNYTSDYIFQDSKGGRHSLYLGIVQNPTSYACQYYHILQTVTSTINSGGDPQVQATVSTAELPLLVTDADGTLYHFANPMLHSTISSPVESGLPDYIEDRNGNKVTVTDSGNGAFTFTDTLARPAIISSHFGATGDTVSVPGLGNYVVTWGTTNWNYGVGSSQTSDPNCNSVIPNTAGINQPVITAITLPNGQQYTFDYSNNPYGLLDKITYPNGGYVSYTWTEDSNSAYALMTDSKGFQGCAYTYGTPAVSTRTVSFDGSTPAQQQTFTYQPTNWGTNGWNSKETDVQTSDSIRGQFTKKYVYEPVNQPNTPNFISLFAMQVPVEQTVTTYDWGGSLIETIAKNWVNQYEMQGQQVTHNGVVVSDQFFAFGAGAQITAKYECGSGQTCYSATQSTPPGSYSRVTKTHYQSFSATPLFTAGPSILDRPSSLIVYNGGGTKVAETDYGYDAGTLAGTSSVANHDYSNYPSSYTNRGNITSVSRWVNTSAAFLATSYTYDDTGQQLSMVDPKSNTTQYFYTDSFAGCGTVGQGTNAYLTKITDAKGFTQSFTYRYCDGQLNSATDRNGQPTSYSYESSLNRLQSITYPDTGSTTYGYANSGDCAQPSSTSVLISAGVTYTESATVDGMCHVTQTAVTSDSPEHDYTDTAYDGEGRVYTVSNPYRTGTPDLTAYTYDSIGRTVSVQYPDGNISGTSYSGASTTITDPQLKSRTLTYDNLGRLVSVSEAGGTYTTNYGYDLLDNLTSVSQGQGSQTRTFVYDSLSRLTSATNPESGVTTYTYPTSNTNPCSGDPSDVCTRTDARNITTTYTYSDSLNRLTSKSYNDGTTPTATFSYDETTVTLGSWTSPSLAFYKGRLTHTTTTSGGTTVAATVQDYDPMGRTQHYWQCTKYNCGNASIYSMPFTYDLAGDVWIWTHPAGFTITNTISGAKQITQISSSLVDSTHPANMAQNITYTPWGALSTLTNGCAGSGCTNAMETYTYNNRMQVSQIQLGTTGNPAAYYTLSYNYSLPGGSKPNGCAIDPAGTSGNNGNVIGYTYTDAVNSTLSHSAFFVYDSVNRLACAQATGNSTYNLAYVYNQDGNGQYGNVTCSHNSYTSGPCPSSPYTFNPATNQITTSGYSYDPAGNLLTDGTYGYTWDAEGRVSTITGSGANESYTYNALGQLSAFTAASNNSSMVYDPAGQWVGQYNVTGGYWWPQYVRLGGRVVAFNSQGTNNTVFLHKDAETTSHMVTGPSGSVLQDQIFYPWGQSWLYQGTWYQQEFAGLDFFNPHDSLYFAPARAYNPTISRWLRPDRFTLSPLHIINPQRWNMYAYSLNNPATLIDPTGLDAIAVNFPNNNPGGHEAIISVHADGRAEFASYGPRGEHVPFGEGNVTAVNLITRVQFGPDGLPTDASYRAIAAEVGGIENDDPSTVRMNYFKTSEAETLALDAFIQRNKDASDRGEAPYYLFSLQNCATFTIAGLLQANAILNQNISIVPNWLFDLLSQDSTENYSQGQATPREGVDSSIDYSTLEFLDDMND